MRIVQITHAGGTDLLRDPHVVGQFVRGVHCNEHGVGLRQEGCSQEAELVIPLDHIESIVLMGGDVTKAKPQLTVEVYKSVTKVRKKERWGVRIKAANHLTLFSSEKYVNHEGARNAADLVADGKFTVIDES